MTNPNGPYPGRQLFVGRTGEGSPAIAYLVTGRSPASRERMAVAVDNTIRIGPLGDTPYDPLRHYNGVKYDDTSGIIVVSNGIQTEAIFEVFKLLYNTESPPTIDYMEKIMKGARAEPDSLQTPRIAGAITSQGTGAASIYIIGIVTAERSVAFQVEPGAGKFYGVSTYHGDMESPGPFDINSGPVEIEFTGNSAADIAEQLFEMSEAFNQEEDIRVCAIGGVLSGDNGTWELAIINTHQERY
ncbi:IMP cyclohydrolase [Chloroflexota bacterium]